MGWAERGCSRSETRTHDGREGWRKKEGESEKEKRGKDRPDERWDNPMSGQRRRSETADGRGDEGDETAHEGKGVATKLREARERERDERSGGRDRQGGRERQGRERSLSTQ